MGELQLIWTGLRRLLPKAIQSLRSNSRAVLYCVVFGCLCWIAWLVLFVQIPGCVYAEKMAQSKQNLHAVQLGLERICCDDRSSCYPLDPGVIVEQGYLDEMPINPFTHQPMRYVVLDRPADEAGIPAGLSHGDFGYCPGRGYGESPAALDLSRLSPGDILTYELVLY